MVNSEMSIVAMTNLIKGCLKTQNKISKFKFFKDTVSIDIQAITSSF